MCELSLCSAAGYAIILTALFFFLNSLLLLLQLALHSLVGFGLLYDFVPQSSIFALLCPISHFSTCSSHLSVGLPTGLDEHGSHSVSFLTVLIVSILITCAAQHNLCDFINLTIICFLIRISNSSFVFILHVPSLSCVGLYIFLRTLLSNISRRFCSVTIIAHVSQPYVTIGYMIDLYICSLLAALRSLFFRSFLFANRLLFPACLS